MDCAAAWKELHPYLSTASPPLNPLTDVVPASSELVQSTANPTLNLATDVALASSGHIQTIINPSPAINYGPINLAFIQVRQEQDVSMGLVRYKRAGGAVEDEVSNSLYFAKSYC